MKKIQLLVLVFFTTTFSAFSSHYVGGEVYWKCIPNTGNYIFYLDFYRDCSANSANVNPAITINLDVLNTPLPNNNALSSIPLQFVPPASGQPLGPNGGLALQPNCIGCAGFNPISCTTQDGGTLEKYSYRSAPIALSGKPPSGNANQNLNGWVFMWESPCCLSPRIENLASNGLIFKAVMYGDGRASQDPCYDSSPQFMEQPTTLVCERYNFQYNSSVADRELDSLAFRWANIVNRSNSNTQFSPRITSWELGFSLTNPTPTSSMNPLNRAARINPVTGAVNMFVVLPNNIPTRESAKYMTSTQVDAWGVDANGNPVKKATVYREMPFDIMKCPIDTFTYVDMNGNPRVIAEQNQPPFIQIDSIWNRLNLDTTIFAGDSINFAFLTIDTNVSRCAPSLLSTVTIEPTGYLFDSTFSAARGNCPIQPCPFLIPAPTGSPIKKLSGLNTVGTRFVWQTDCDHLDVSNIVGGASQFKDERTFNFVMKTYDDYCPVTAVQYATISITVKAPRPLGPPVLRCLLENTDGSYTITWSGPQVASQNSSFRSYQLFIGTRPIGSSAAFTFQSSPIATGLMNFNGSFTTQAYAPGQEYAFRMKTKWGCSGQEESVLSAAIDLSSIPSGVQGNITQAGSTLNLDITDATSYQWFRNGVAVPLSNSSVLTGISPGTYYVDYFYNSCQYTSNSFQATLTSLNDQQLSALKVTTFPNPTNGRLNVIFNQVVKMNYAEVYGLDGQLIFRNENQTALDISNLPPNIYLLKVSTDKGVFFEKVIKK